MDEIPGLQAVSRLSSLDDPLRRRLYAYVAAADEPVSRERAAAAAGIGRTLAAYHLDKLADAALLTVTYARPAGRGGPGAGRPAKLYAPAERELTASVPPRDYELLARLLVSSVRDDTSGVARSAVDEAAFDAGRNAGSHPGGDLIASLRRCGYQPRQADGDIELRNCPFHAVAQQHQDLVCGLNLHLVKGVIAGSGHTRAHAVLDPRPGKCCVVVHDQAAAHPAGRRRPRERATRKPQRKADTDE